MRLAGVCELISVLVINPSLSTNCNQDQNQDQDQGQELELENRRQEANPIFNLNEKLNPVTCATIAAKQNIHS